ncbi:EthD family reductase [Cohnella candidum]|uniref:EthD family reductase n=1 Tax=Cohnella candidum TaxID=2674991 RepID=A0A3G3JZM7_9BACL|nr:EthD family reductase [Cohnella candidum]AYQ73698.1 EthD family reductase [Cohnella candidum]
MVKVTVLLPMPQDLEGFARYYDEVHLPLVRELPNVKRVSVQRVLDRQSASAPYWIAEFGFDSGDLMRQALEGPEGQRLYADVPNLVRFLGSEPQVLFSEEWHR